MLDNLGSEEELPALQSGSASPPRQSPNNNNDVEEGRQRINSKRKEEKEIIKLSLGSKVSWIKSYIRYTGILHKYFVDVDDDGKSECSSE